MGNLLLWLPLLLAASGAAPAAADSGVVPPPGLEDSTPAPPPGGVSVSPNGRILVSPAACPALAGGDAVPGADYQPGVDVHGKPVAPADLPSAAPAIPPIAIGAGLRRRYGGSALFHGQALLGLVTVRDGRAYIDGQPIGDQERALLAAGCRAAGR